MSRISINRRWFAFLKVRCGDSLCSVDDASSQLSCSRRPPRPNRFTDSLSWTCALMMNWMSFFLSHYWGFNTAEDRTLSVFNANKHPAAASGGVRQGLQRNYVCRTLKKRLIVLLVKERTSHVIMFHHCQSYSELTPHLTKWSFQPVWICSVCSSYSLTEIIV